jgi:hypothetical protein
MLEFSKGINEVLGEKVIIMDELREQFPEKFNESGAMDYKWFEADIRPNNFIYIRNDVNSLSFTFQKGAIKEYGKNGCQIDCAIALVKELIIQANKQFPCHENKEVINHLDGALSWLLARTENRKKRQVEGTSNI